MNRQIKFRGKRLDNRKWVYGDLLHIDGGCLIYFGSQTEVETPYIEKCSPIAVELFKTEIAVVAPDTVGQFTGLHDRNGKEIYEGDILGVPHKDGIKQHFYRIVEYCCDGFYLIDNCHEGKYGDLLHREISLDGKYAGIAKTLRRFGCDYCVVGNIHDNPELLKGGAE